MNSKLNNSKSAKPTIQNSKLKIQNSSVARLLFSVHCLASCDSYHVVDILYLATTREVVDRKCDTLKDRTDGNGVAETLNELVRDVAYFEIRNNEYIGMTGNR